MKRGGGFGQSVKVVLGVCLVCSFFVSAAAVWLSGRQAENQRRDKIRNILVAADLYPADGDAGRVFRRRIEPALIELETGERAAADRLGVDFRIDDFDVESFAADPALGEAIPVAADVAKIKRRPKLMAVYFVKRNGGPDKLVLPIYGKGLWSTIYGYLALKEDFKTVAGVTFYRHGETPGLGGEIDNSDWQRQWKGKRAIDDQGRVILDVVRGEADLASKEVAHQIDGLAGATLTSRGVDRMLKYWLGRNGYGPFLTRLRRDSGPARMEE
ncbi:MAG: Na(+)-translocating NADH-quinone reductase subunit C [Gammaproteobacteria bacterium]